MAAPPLLRAPVLVVPRRVNAVVRALAEDLAAAPVTAADGTVLGRVRQEPPPRAPVARGAVSRRLAPREQHGDGT